MNLILSSCDFGNPKSAKVILDNLPKPISECKVLFFPNENATPEKIESGKYEFRVAAFGFQKKNIYVANYYHPESFLHMDVDVIYISGGNTFGTIKRIRESGLDQLILNCVHNGATYIGGSAGAHIATANLSHIMKYDQNTFGLTDFSGLGLYKGILICHYSDSRKDDLEHLLSSSIYEVQALSNEDSIVIKET